MDTLQLREEIEVRESRLQTALHLGNEEALKTAERERIRRQMALLDEQLEAIRGDGGYLDDEGMEVRAFLCRLGS